MGKGNVATHNSCEGLFYLDKTLVYTYRKAIRCSESGHILGFAKEGNESEQPEDRAHESSHTKGYLSRLDSEQDWSNMVAFMKNNFSRKFPSFKSMEGKWHRYFDGGETILESTLFQIVVIDSNWSVAFCLLEHCDVNATCSNRFLMRSHYKSYLDGIRDALLEGWGEAIERSGKRVYGNPTARGGTS